VVLVVSREFLWRETRYDWGMGKLLATIRRAKELWSWYSFTVGVGALAVAGATTAIGGAVWLIRAGIPLPLALMAGFCTLVGAVYLAMAPMAYRFLSQKAQSERPVRAPTRLNLTAIRLQHQYTILAASRLWVGIDPNKVSTPDSVAWFDAIVSAIQQDKLTIQSRWGSDEHMKAIERSDPMTTTVVNRDDLKKFATSIGQDPEFLRDS
jgi:hypothetical protein